MQNAETEAKKEYRTPELHVYGDIRTITQTASAGRISDRSGGNTRTA
jgi:hypothetical protein